MREQVLIFTPPAATSYRQLDRFLGLLAPQPPTEWRPKYLPVFSAFCCCLEGPECIREGGKRCDAFSGFFDSVGNELDWIVFLTTWFLGPSFALKNRARQTDCGIFPAQRKGASV